MSISPAIIEGTAVRDRLLNAAEQVVGRDGVANLTLEAVAREAHVSKGGLLYHFRSKSALVTAIVERLASRCEAEQNRVLAQADPNEPGAFTRAYVIARTRVKEPREELIHSALLAAAGTDQQFMEPIRQRFVEWQTKLESDGIDPVTAVIVRLAIDGLCLDKLLGVPVPTGELRRKILDQLLEMTAAPNKP
jgi:AcrR family transcriptional regulator